MTTSRDTSGPRSWVGAVALMVAVALVAGACTSDAGPATATWPVDSPAVTVNSPASCAEVGCAGDGVDTATGTYRSEAADALFPPGLFGIELSRSYRSDNGEAGWFGRGWATIYETTLVVDADAVGIDAPVGLAPLWTPEAPSAWGVVGSPIVSQTGGGYALSWPTGERWTFGPGGALQSLSSPYRATVTIKRTPAAITLTSTQGVTVTFGLDAGKVVSAETSDGRSAAYTYAGDLLTSVSAPGIELRYRYDGDARLVSVTTPAGTTTVTYADGAVASQRTASGERLAFAYDRGVTTVRSNGVEATYEHDTDARLVRIAYGDHDVLTQSFDGDGRLVRRMEYAQPGDHPVSSVERSYTDGRLVAETVNGVPSTYRYDAFGRVTEVAGATTTSFEYTGNEPLPVAVTTPANGRSTISYHDGFVVRVTDATGVTSLAVRDALGNSTGTGGAPDALWRYEFDAEGNVTTTTSPSGRVWTAQWAPRSLPTRESDPIGRVTSHAYDTAGRLVREATPGGRATERSYNEAGQLVAVTEPGGLTTRYEYDTAGRTATVVMPGDRTWRTSYDDRSDGSQQVTSTAPDGTQVVTTLDSAGREIERLAIEADGTQVEATLNTYEFDRLVSTTVRRGRSELVTATFFDDAGRAINVESTLDGVVTRSDSYTYVGDRIVAARSGDDPASYSYDDAGRLIEVSSGDETWVVTYRGGDVVSTRHDDDTIDIERDPDGRPVRYVVNGVITTWRYDDADRPVSRTVAEAVARFEWDASDQLTSYDAPTGARWTWKYDEAGRLNAAAEPGGSNTTYEYELASVSRIRTKGGGRERDERFGYDARGLLRTAETSGGKYQYEYDAAGRVVAADGPRGNDDESWLLNAAGQVVAVTVDGREYELTYTDAGRIGGIAGPNDEFLDATWRDGHLAGVETDGHDALDIIVDREGRLVSVSWDDDTAVDLEWRDEESFVVGQRGTNREFDYTITDGHLTGFTGNGVTYSLGENTSGFLGALTLASDAFEGTVRFDAFGRPATLSAAERTSTITYDTTGRVSSVLTTRPGGESEQTTVNYDDGRKIDGNGDLVKALFDDSGALKQSLPNTLRNPLSAGADSVALQQALLIEGTDDLLVAEPDPFAQVEAALTASTPAVTTPVGVRDRLRLARQMVVAEVGRLAPTVSVNDGLSVQVPIVNPDNGKLIDYNPFVDAVPSGLALGVLARQAGGGGSLLDRAVDRLGDVVGGVVSFSKHVAHFVTTNPVVRLVVSVAAFAVPVACALIGPACVGPGAVVLRIAAAITLASAGREIANTCPSGAVMRCGVGIALAALSVVQFSSARQIAGALVPSRPAMVNGRPTINGGYAGRAYDGPGWTAEMRVKYPAEVQIDKSGFARFEPYSRASVRSSSLTGEYARDAAIANRAVGLTRTPAGYTWHHVEDGRTLILIPTDVHTAVRHTGGAAVLRGVLSSGT